MTDEKADSAAGETAGVSAASQKTTPAENWQQPSLDGLAALTLEMMPGFEVLFIDELAAYLMGAGGLEPPFTVEHGSRVVSALFGSVVNASHYVPDQQPEVSDGMTAARQEFVKGAHAFAAKGIGGINQLANRLIPAVLGELEIYKAVPEDQTSSLFYYSLLAVASGPLNLMAPVAADGVLELFSAWDGVFGGGFIPPWRQPVS